MSFISFRNKHENIWAQIAGVKVWESSKQKLLVVVIDRDYRFIKIIKFNEFSTKKTFTEIVCRSPVWTLSIALDVSWQRNKQKENLSNTITSDIFPITVLNYNLRSQTDFLRNTVNTTKFGLNSLRHFASKVWSMIPIEIKNSSTVETFKSKISKWEPKTVTANFVKIICMELVC